MKLKVGVTSPPYLGDAGRPLFFERPSSPGAVAPENFVSDGADPQRRKGRVAVAQTKNELASSGGGESFRRGEAGRRQVACDGKEGRRFREGRRQRSEGWGRSGGEERAAKGGGPVVSGLGKMNS
ncbi:hypothetical protein Salat_2544000 [Sesamum alatum]|uniref:Uncharacterized protein n=1 Tax=Sesamum alatum TaxID=300844 RepID=A0AAE2CCK2_9LAMI|nr:hypothetical protein Salat_2544000 [Sesamum alatum]